MIRLASTHTRLSAVLLALGLAVTATPVAAVAPAQPAGPTGPTELDALVASRLAPGDRRPLANVDHLDFIYDTVTPPDQTGHTSYRLDQDPTLGVVWVYTHHNPDGSYTRVGGGAYDADANTWGQGSYDTDDITRNAVAYLRHWRQVGDDHSRDQAYQLLRGTAYFQTVSGPNRGNFMIWMQPDGTLVSDQVPQDGNDEQANWSLARGIWAYGEGYAAFAEQRPMFAEFLQDRIQMSMDALDREVLDKYGQYQTVDGLRWPLWFIPGCWCEPYGDAGATADAMQGLIAYLEATEDSSDPDTVAARQRAARIVTQFADGLEQMALGDAYQWPFGAIMPNPGYRAAWHGWGTMMPGVLADAGRVLHRQDWIDTAADSLARFAPHLLVQGGPDNFWAPTPVSRVQFGFSVDNLVQNLYKVGVAAHSRGLRDLAGITAGWYFGDNYAGAQMYDPDTGRLYDGLDGSGAVNTNAGAETAHAVMSMLLLDAHPRLAALAMASAPVDRHTWQLAEAEDGTLSGDASVSDPCQFVVAEGWCSGREVLLGTGGKVGLSIDVSKPGRYVLMVAAHREELRAGAIGAAIKVDGAPLDTIDLGGAGPQGVTPRPGYPDVVTIDQPVEVGDGDLTLEVSYQGEPGRQVRLDGVLVQPLVESKVTGTGDGAHAVLRSFAHRWETETVRLSGQALTAWAYGQSGQLLRIVSRNGDQIDAPVAPGGFTIVTGGRRITTQVGEERP